MIGIKPRCFGTDNPWISYISFYVRHFHLICINHYLSKERCVSFRGRLSSSSRFYSTSSKYDWVWIGSGRTFIADIDSVTAKTEFLLKRMMITKFLRIKVSGKHGCITCPLKGEVLGIERFPNDVPQTLSQPEFGSTASNI